MIKEKFQKTSWYRLLQVFFVSLFLLVLSAVIGIFITYKPERYLDNSKSSIICISGKYKDNHYPLDKNSFYIYSWDDEFSESEKIDARKLCAYDKLGITYSSEYSDPQIENYRLNKVYGINNSWSEAFGYSILYVLGVVIGFGLFKRIFFFIAFGENIFTGFND